MLFGAPTYAFRATRGIKGAGVKVSMMGLDGKLVGAFDTYQASRHNSKCAKQIEKELQKRAKDAILFTRHLSSLVLGREGPLKDDEPEKAVEFGKDVATELSA